MPIWECEVESLYFPVPAIEYSFIRESGYTRFPRPNRTFIHPVPTDAYARILAASWIVTHVNIYVVHAFIAKDFIKSYTPRQTDSVGNHKEYWIPRNDIDKLNEAIIGVIETVGVVRR